MMDDLNKSSSLLSLPPGCRFYPSDDEIFQYYLRLKNNPTNTTDELNACGVIQEINLRNFNPFDLPDFACFRFGFRGRKRHWYCYRERINGGRKAELGFWKRKGKVRDVMGEAGVVLGKRTCFVFYSIKDGLESDNRSKRGVKTDCFMYEYDLIDDKASFVLCRIFFKSPDQNYVPEHALSCAEESAVVVRHVGIQHDGGDISDIGEDDMQVRSSDLDRGNVILENALDDQLSKYILEGDFIELDDLI